LKIIDYYKNKVKELLINTCSSFNTNTTNTTNTTNAINTTNTTNNIDLYKCMKLIISNRNKNEKEKDKFKKLVNDFNEIYNKTRYGIICNSSSEFTNNSNNKENKKCEDINNNNLIDAINKNNNIVLESVGLQYPNWLFEQDKFPNIKNYRIIFAYSLVSFKNLIERNINRFLQVLLNFIKKKYSSPAPRLPNIIDEDFKAIITNIKDLMIKIIEKCIENNNVNNSSDIKKCFFNDLIIFSNDTKESIVLFDSSSIENKSEFKINDFKNKINILLSLDNSVLGRGYNKTVSKINKLLILKKDKKDTRKLNTKKLKNRKLKTRKLKTRKIKTSKLNTRLVN
jgi:hypothetical protein